MNVQELLAQANRLRSELEKLAGEIGAVFEATEGLELSEEEGRAFYGAAGDIGVIAADLYSSMEEYSQNEDNDEDLDDDDF